MWRLAADARRLGVDAVADVHGVLRSVMFRTALWLRGSPRGGYREGREEKKEFIRKGGRDVKPAKHTVVRYCDVFRKLGFVFDDPVPALRRCRPNPMGEKTGTWIGFSPFSAQQGKPIPRRSGGRRCVCWPNATTGCSYTAEAEPKRSSRGKWSVRTPM